MSLRCGGFPFVPIFIPIFVPIIAKKLLQKRKNSFSIKVFLSLIETAETIENTRENEKTLQPQWLQGLIMFWCGRRDLNTSKNGKNH